MVIGLLWICDFDIVFFRMRDREKGMWSGYLMEGIGGCIIFGCKLEIEFWTFVGIAADLHGFENILQELPLLCPVEFDEKENEKYFKKPEENKEVFEKRLFFITFQAGTLFL